MNDEQTIREGDILKDNDPRMPDRYLIVQHVGVSGVDAQVRGASRRTVSISHKRIFTDGKPRRSGFSKVSQ